ncbi:Crp/Fnr family transcriptional regulator [Pseudobutyrivibrio sp. MD2005]|uniref:Crp/Fnr family transcriptional regulator n=1 Tax=Pseudobutyrivibrio sp. MD2005 TaxID=1410616 RepID=UPI00048567F6|nr:cyclic nucleotide-binding domain-containing protein [Pseudobutyrivibrio sp. MD2005]
MGSFFDNNSVLNRDKIYDVPAGIVVLQEGEKNLDMYKIISGHVEMYTGYGTENEVLIGLLGPEACFGEFGILTGAPAIYTIVTYSETKLLRVTEETMNDFIEKYQDDVLKIMKNMANNMMKMQYQLTQFSQELMEMQSEDSSKAKEKVFLTTEEVKKEVIKGYATGYGNVGFNKAKMRFRKR